MELNKEQRGALASFLKSRRKRLSPKAAGVRHSYGRRRTSGLRREELADLAGVSVTWYTWLEQARSIRVSRQVMNSLSRALQMDDTETEYLFRLAGEAPPLPRQPCSREEIPEQYLTFLGLLNPLPAMITNYRFDILAWNDALCVLFPYFEDFPADERNALLLTFDDRTRALYPEWEEHAVQTVALFRAMNAERLVQPDYARLIENLGHRASCFREMWNEMRLEPARPSLRMFDHPAIGRIQLGYVKLQLPAADATLVVHQPAPDQPALTRLGELVDERRRSLAVQDGGR